MGRGEALKTIDGTMVPKGSQRGGGQQLATHLLNEFDNDRVELADVRGAIARDVHGVFAEWRAISRATQCRKYLYSLSLNPDPKQGTLTREQYVDFINRAEKKLGLGEQARVVVFHVKHGREHCHVVWSRIDERTMKAVQLSYDHQALRTVVQGFARDYGLKLPLSMQKNRGRERYKDRLIRENLFEQQQEERSGITKAERVAALTQAWRESKTGKELIAALEKRGYLLARGDSRSYVVVDRAGEIHSLARDIEGARVKDVRARLAGFPPEKLPDARKAQEFFREQMAQQRAREAGLQLGRPPEQRRRSPKERRDDLARRHALRRAAIAAQKAEIEKEHRLERDLLLKAQKLEELDATLGRQTSAGRALKLLMRITGLGRIAQSRRKREAAQRALEHKLQREKLDRRHHRELVDFRHREHALASVEARERRSLETQIRREGFERISGRDRDRSTGRDGRPPPRRRMRAEFTGAATRTREQARRETADTLLDTFYRSAHQGLWTSLIGAPQQAARWLRGVLTRLFNHSDKRTEAHRADPRAANIAGKLRAAFAGAAELPVAFMRRAKRQELIDVFRRSAGNDPRARGSSGTAALAPEKSTRTAQSAPDPADESVRGTLSQPFNDPRKHERSRDAPAPARREGLSGTFGEAASRVGERRKMKEEILAEFRRCAGGSAAAGTITTRRSGPMPSATGPNGAPVTRGPAAGSDAGPSRAP